jgi:hypothetical protein
VASQLDLQLSSLCMGKSKELKASAEQAKTTRGATPQDDEFCMWKREGDEALLFSIVFIVLLCFCFLVCEVEFYLTVSHIDGPFCRRF